MQFLPLARQDGRIDRFGEQGVPEAEAPRRLLGGNSTTNSAVTTSASASHSCGPGRSPSNRMPEITPTTGTGSDDSDDTATGRVWASVNHAQCASVPARKTL